MSDINCPYCNAEQDIYHDDGQGYEEEKLHEQYCSDCSKTFTFYTSILFCYESFKADCLNGDNHKFKPSHTYPKFYTRMCCSDCETERKLTENEWLDIMDPMEVVQGYYK